MELMLILSVSLINMILIMATGNTLCKSNEELKKELENLKQNLNELKAGDKRK